jgi:glycogen operon protein
VPPVGVTVVNGGVQVAVMSRNAARIFFCVFEDGKEAARIALPQRLGDVHYGFIPGVRAGARYGFRVEGPWDPDSGHRFDVSKLLLDPYALAIDGPFRHHSDLALRGQDTSALVPKGIVTSVSADAKPLPPHRPRFIYEIPVKAFTELHPGIASEKRGTVSALGDPAIVAHLKRLGVDTVELMPLAAWTDERHLAPLKLSNAWGYNPVSFLAPDPRLAPGGLGEIRAAVDALHAEGIRVVLDVVFNHTGESDEHGAVLSLRGLDNALYYRHAGGRLVNDTGCGNTLALDERPVMQLAMDAMRSWVTRTGIDGFRFDLAPVMGRRATGFDTNAPLLAAIEQDPLLSQLIMIAEPWDVGPGGYRLGQFPARWQEWNDRYRDDVRRFWRGDAHAAGALATRLTGSSDIFAPHRPPSASINYVAAHDGFTLRDAVTYTLKNNHANGEQNRDGNAHEPTWPGGDEKALLATLFLSRGTPMLTAGDEFGRSQRGNNNAYAQDNETTWLDWNTADQPLIDFTASLVKLRQSQPLLCADSFLSGERLNGGPHPDAQWLGTDGESLNWHDPETGVVVLVLADETTRLALCFNRTMIGVHPSLLAREGYRWRVLLQTSGDDLLPPGSVAVYAEERMKQVGISDAALRELAGEAGIESDWWEVDGTYHAVTPDTLRHLLGAMRLPHATVEDAEGALRSLRARPQPIIADARHVVTIAPATDRRQIIHLRDEHGKTRTLEVKPGEAAALQLPAGYYDAQSEGDASKRGIIVSPGTCHLPEDIANGARVFGLASHLYALRHAGDQGIGDFETLRRFANVTHDIGGRYAGLNPLHHLFPTDRSRASPYQPSDRRFIDPIYISTAKLLERFDFPKAKALAAKSRAAFAALEKLQYVDYAAVWAAKSAILEAAFSEFRGDASHDDFVRNGGDALIAHGKFEAKLAGEAQTPTRIAYRGFLQWVADLQLREAASHHNLYRDLALGCAFDGGEIAEAPSRFAEGVSIGAPPDPFSRAGQVWNLPPFSPVALAAENYTPMRTILSANMRHAAALRIDHILGFARQFWVPRGAEGRFGAYVRFPMDALIAVTAIESQRSRCLIVGEDLGTIPDGLREKLAEAHILSYRVLWFEREGAGFKPPESYPAHALTCLASHDLPTYSGWRAARDIAISVELGQLSPEEAERREAERKDEIRRLDEIAGATSAAVHAFVARTPSQVMLVQADDLAGESEPLNVPGTDTERPNWRRRLSAGVDDMMAEPLARGIIDAVKEIRQA